MPEDFTVGDPVTWNSPEGHINGKIAKIHTADTHLKGKTYKGSKEEPIYEVKSDKTDATAMHKGSALKKIKHG